jgi:dephospho-CoA kinase
VVLIGLSGSGKTTVGRIVAERLHAGFVDIDSILNRKEGKPIAMIFAEKGEGAFREMERKEMEAGGRLGGAARGARRRKGQQVRRLSQDAAGDGSGAGHAFGNPSVVNG